MQIGEREVVVLESLPVGREIAESFVSENGIVLVGGYIINKN
jgi:hypothetical protein